MLIGLAALPKLSQAQSVNFGPFTASDTSGCVPLVVNFTANLGALGNPTSFSWSFSDNTNSSLQDPGKIFPTAGSFDVTLTVSTASGPQTFTFPDAIKVYAKPNTSFTSVVQPPVPCSTFMNVQFTDASSPDVTSWLWDFGDGSSDTVQNPLHSYATAGTHLVSLIATNAQGCEQIFQTSVTVVAPSGLNAAFTHGNTALCDINTPINFTDQSTAPGAYSRSWTFGDGGTSTAANPSHTYGAPGIYNVQLIIANSQGCADTVSQSITVTGVNLFAGFSSMTPQTICQGTTVNFLAQDSTLNYNWRFGVGNASAIGHNVSYTYTTPGTYTIRVISIASATCRDTLFLTNHIIVLPPVTVNLSVNAGLVGCAYPVPYVFSTTGTTGMTRSYVVYDGAGSLAGSYTGTGNFTFQVPNAGTYTAQVTVTNGACTATDTLQFTISSALTAADFTMSMDSGCVPLAVSFINTSFIGQGDTVTGQLWDFGDPASGVANSSTLPNPFHTYTATGQVFPSLTLYTAQGCTSIFTLPTPIKTGTPPVADFFPKDTSGCSPLTVKPRNATMDTLVNGSTTYTWKVGDAFYYGKSPSITLNVPGVYGVTLYTYNNGCVDSLFIDSAWRVDSPMADFNSPNRIGCDTPWTVSFIDQSIGALTWYWDFGDPASGTANTSTLVNPFHTYTQFGNYTIKLIVTNPNGCIDSLVKKNYVKISDPHANYLITSDTIGCFPLTVAFLNTSTTGTYRWDFGDGGISTAANPTYTYMTPGYYTVRLIVRDANGCEDTLQRLGVITSQGPRPKFTNTNANGCKSHTVSFTDQSIPFNAPIIRYLWDFGDTSVQNGTDTSNLQNPSYTYTTNGAFTVSLTVWDSNGCSTTLTKAALVRVRNPLVKFTADTLRCVGLPVVFDANVQNGAFYLWSFGDGSTDTGAAPSHVYSAPGYYNIKLIATNTWGCTDSLTKYAYVHITDLLIKPSATPNVAVCAPKPIQFRDSTAYAISWYWTFGDGTTSNLKNPLKIYNTNGWFDVSLAVTTSAGCSDTIFIDSMVHIVGPQASYSFATGGHCVPAAVQFTNTSVDYVTSIWDFGDGATSTATNPTHTYTNPGTYNPILIVTDASGCQSSANPQPQILVDSVPIAGYTVTYSASCGPTPATFTNTSQYGVTQMWYFGDGDSSGATNPTHTYLPGTYTATLVIWNSAGCTDTFNGSQPIVINMPPTAAFTPDAPFGCLPHTVNFTNNSQPYTGATIVAYLWNFGDPASGAANTSTLANPSHTYTQQGLYTVWLVVTDNFGCSDTLIQPDLISIKDTVAPPATSVELVSVENDNAVRVTWFKSNDPYFAAYRVERAPTGVSSFLTVTTLTNANDTTWADASINVQAGSYCYRITAVDLCGRQSAASQEHCSVLLSSAPAADPSINGIDLGWTPYVGWTNLDRYRIYREHPTIAGAMTYLDSVPATKTTYTDAGLCPDTIRYLIVAVDGAGKVLTSLSNTSAAPTSYRRQVTALDVSVSSVKDDQAHTLTTWPRSISNNGVQYIVYKANDQGVFAQAFTTTDTFLLDGDVNVNESQYGYRVQTVDSCKYANPLGRMGQTILLKATSQNFDILLDWTPYQDWVGGVASYRVDRFNSATAAWDSFATTNAATTSLFASYNALNNGGNGVSNGDYKFRVVAFEKGAGVKPERSFSNHAEAILPPTLFVPTAFSPNGDGTNELFATKSLNLATYRMEVYNRWGQRLFESTDPAIHWDGTFKGEIVATGLYVYKVEATGRNGQILADDGTVSVLR